MCFWNVAGLLNKCEETWEYLEDFDIVGLVETWVEEERWEKVKERLPSSLIWNCEPANREHKKGRAKGGIIMAANKRMKNMEIRRVNEAVMECKMEYNGNKWRIITLYSKEIDREMKAVMEHIQEEEEECLVIGGDFNARTGNGGGPIREDEEEKSERRKSIDKVTNKEGRWLIGKIEERGWAILNGSFEEEGGWTYIGETGTSVIDYVIGNDRAGAEIRRVTEGGRTESDHTPLEVELIGPQMIGKEKRKKMEREIERSDWTEEGEKRYQEKCKGWISTQNKTEDIWKEIKEKVKEAITKKKKKIHTWRLGKREWYNKEWKDRKKELRRALKDLKKGKSSKEEYVRRRKKYKEWCEVQKKKHEEEEEEKIRNIRSEAEAWRYINKFRKKKTGGMSDNIQMEEWRDHFMELLGGSQEKQVLCIEENEMEEDRMNRGKEIEDITKEELIEILRKLKKAKAPEEDGIENEAWRFMNKEIGEEFWKMINRIWKGEGIPTDGNKGLISPIHKKGEKEEVKNYRGITLMDTAYKIYASILNEKLEKEIEDKLKEGQFGFRKGRGTMDAVYVINYVANRELSAKGGKVFAFFADLKAAFDNVDRKQLNEIMKEMEIEDNLRRRVMETYKETRNVVKIGDKKSEEFWTEKGLRQGCPLSPTLFNIYVTDLEEELKKGQSGGIVIGREKFWTIIYADDIVLLAKRESELKEMLKRFKKILEKKGLRLSPEKSKVIVFEKGRGRLKRREWKWGEENIEEVKEIKYLGYTLQKNGGIEKHIRERMKKAMVAMKRTWSIGERLFKEDFGRRMKMFTSLVESIGLYGAEVWGWQEDNRLDGIKRKYTKWILRLDWRTPNYILAEETKIREIKTRALRRAIKYEEKVRNTKKKLIQECIKDLEKERQTKEESNWERKRREALERIGRGKEQRSGERETEGQERGRLMNPDTTETIRT